MEKIEIHIKMLEDCKGSDVDHKGIALPVITYLKGSPYQIGVGLYDCFVDLGVCELLAFENIEEAAESISGIEVPKGDLKEDLKNPQKIKKKGTGRKTANKIKAEKKTKGRKR